MQSFSSWIIREIPIDMRSSYCQGKGSGGKVTNFLGVLVSPTRASNAYLGVAVAVDEVFVEQVSV